MGLDGHIYKGRMDTRLPGILGKDGELPDSLDFLLGSCLGSKGHLSLLVQACLDHWAPSIFFLLPRARWLFPSGRQQLDPANCPAEALSFLPGLHPHSHPHLRAFLPPSQFPCQCGPALTDFPKLNKGPLSDSNTEPPESPLPVHNRPFPIMP